MIIYLVLCLSLEGVVENILLWVKYTFIGIIAIYLYILYSDIQGGENPPDLANKSELEFQYAFPILFLMCFCCLSVNKKYMHKVMKYYIRIYIYIYIYRKGRKYYLKKKRNQQKYYTLKILAENY